MNDAGRVGIAAGVAGAVAAGAALYQGQYPTAQLYGPTIHRERCAGKRLALTFDDGPNPEQTPRLLELLASYDARATFFLIGKWAHREPALVGEIVARGHAIGNHTYSHPTMPARSSKWIRDDLRRCREAVEASGERFSAVDGRALMRPPYGRRRPGTLRTLRDEGYVPVTWSITGYDWRTWTTANAIRRRCVRAKCGDIILLHDGSHTEPAKDRSRSVDVTAQILDHFTPRGYSFVSVPELVAAGR